LSSPEKRKRKRKRKKPTKEEEEEREDHYRPMVVIAKDYDMGGIRHWHGVHCEPK
jgi:hypothetical protein